MTERPPHLGPLRRNRDFVLLWCGQTISVLGSRASAVAFPLLVLDMTHSASKAGLAGFVATLPYLLFYLPAGGIVDRSDRKRLMLACEATRMVALGSIAAALLLDRLTYGQVLLVGFVEGTAFAFFSVAEKSALPAVVPAAQIPKALAGNEGRDRAAGWAGPALGGLLFGLSRALPFAVDAVSYALSLGALAGVRADLRPTRDRASGGLRRDIAEGMRFLWRQHFVRMSVLLVGVINIAFQALTLVLIVLLRGHGASVVGLVLGCLGAGGLLGAFAAPALQRRLAPRIVVIGATWAWTALFVLLALPSPPLVVGALVVVMTFIGTLWNVIVVGYQYTVIPDRLLGRVKSCVLLVAWGTIPLGALLAGRLLESIGPVRSLLTLAALMLAAAVVATSSPAIRAVCDPTGG